MREDDSVLIVHIGDKGNGGCPPWAPHWAWERSLVYKIDHFIAAETAQFLLIAVPATDHAWQVFEGGRVILRSSPLAMWMIVMEVLLVVGDQAVPAPLVARQGGAEVSAHYHVLDGAPALKIGGDPVAGPHVGFVVGVSSCRGHLHQRQKARSSVSKMDVINIY